MNRLIEFFPELQSSGLSPGEEAARLGLKPIAWGRYVDPKNPTQVVAKNVNGKLTAVPGMGGGVKNSNLKSLKVILMKKVKTGELQDETAKILFRDAEYAIINEKTNEKEAILIALRRAVSEMNPY